MSVVSRAANQSTSVSVRRREATKRASRAYLDVVKAKRARRAHPGSDAHTEGDPPHYTDKEVQQLGEEGLALKKLRGGGFHYPIKTRRDLFAAIAAFSRALPSEREAVKRWIKLRAHVMGLQELLPISWQSKAKVRPGPRERTPENSKPDSGETSSVGGQSQ